MEMPLSFCTATPKDAPFVGWRLLWPRSQITGQGGSYAAMQHCGRGAGFIGHWCGLKLGKMPAFFEVIRQKNPRMGRGAA